MITLKAHNELHLFPVDEMHPASIDRIKRRLTFDNPAFIENARMGYSNWQTPREIRVYRLENNEMIVPRGFFSGLIGSLKMDTVEYRIFDCRRSLSPVDFHFQGLLHDFQKPAVEAILGRDSGVLAAPTGSGKTVICLAAIAQRRQPALIITHTKELLDQWIARIDEFLGIPSDDVGQVGGGQFTIGKKVTVALVQSLYKCAADIAPHIGHLIVDECHRCPSRTFTEAVTAFDARFLLGLSATPYRRDRLSRLIYWHLGNKVYDIDQSALIAAGHILQVDVTVRKTDFFTTLDCTKEYSTVMTQLAADYERNSLIVQDVIREANNGSGVCLVLSDRKAHCDMLMELLRREGIKAELLTGALGDSERRRIVEDLNNGKVKVLIATGQLIGEGFDCKALSTLFLCMPIHFEGRLIQYLGRILRPAPGKMMARVFDYCDENIPVLRNSARGRQWVYGRKTEVVE